MLKNISIITVLGALFTAGGFFFSKRPPLALTIEKFTENNPTQSKKSNAIEPRLKISNVGKTTAKQAYIPQDGLTISVLNPITKKYGTVDLYKTFGFDLSKNKMDLGPEEVAYIPIKSSFGPEYAGEDFKMVVSAKINFSGELVFRFLKFQATASSNIGRDYFLIRSRSR